MAAQILSTSEGATLILTLSNPEHRNAMGPEIYAAGVEALNVAESSPEVHSVVITGAGSMFSAGAICNACWPTGKSRPSTKRKALRACITGSRPSVPFQSPSLQRLKAPQQVLDFHWLWPVI